MAYQNPFDKHFGMSPDALHVAKRYQIFKGAQQVKENEALPGVSITKKFKSNNLVMYRRTYWNLRSKGLFENQHLGDLYNTMSISETSSNMDTLPWISSGLVMTPNSLIKHYTSRNSNGFKSTTSTMNNHVLQPNFTNARTKNALKSSKSEKHLTHLKKLDEMIKWGMYVMNFWLYEQTCFQMSLRFNFIMKFLKKLKVYIEFLWNKFAFISSLLLKQKILSKPFTWLQT